MNEKSKAFELIEFVWNNEKTDSYLRVNIAMYGSKVGYNISNEIQ